MYSFVSLQLFQSYLTWSAVIRSVVLIRYMNKAWQSSFCHQLPPAPWIILCCLTTTLNIMVTVMIFSEFQLGISSVTLVLLATWCHIHKFYTLMTSQINFEMIYLGVFARNMVLKTKLDLYWMFWIVKWLMFTKIWLFLPPTRLSWSALCHAISPHSIKPWTPSRVHTC